MTVEYIYFVRKPKPLDYKKDLTALFTHQHQEKYGGENCIIYKRVHCLYVGESNWRRELYRVIKDFLDCMLYPGGQSLHYGHLDDPL